MKTIKTLRQEGYKVRVIHSRYFGCVGGVLFPENDNPNPSESVMSKGGKTHIDVTTPEGKTVSGEAVCSNKDNFNRKIGNNIALGRALAKLHES